MGTLLQPDIQDSFPKTRWSLVLQAGGEDKKVSQRALEELCAMYWQPIYIYIRGRGWKVEEAQDLTQGFFAHFLKHDSLRQANHELGKLRSYLLGSVKNFLASEYRKMNAEKRGGDIQVLSLDHEHGEQQWEALENEGGTPEQLYEKMWTRTLIGTVISQLRNKYQETGREVIFEALQPTLVGESDLKPQRVLARELGTSLASIKVEVFRLRQRFRALLECEIEQTLDEEEEVAEEVKYLLAIWEG